MLFYFQMELYGEMDKLKEEKITLSVRAWLINNGWEIKAFDFPQSGTGKVIHPDKNHVPVIIPDIIATKNSNILIIESKDRYLKSDIEKLITGKKFHSYDKSIKSFVQNDRATIYWGAAGPNTEIYKKCLESHKYEIDFSILVNLQEISVFYSNINEL